MTTADALSAPTAAIHLSDAAVTRVRSLLQQRNLPDHALRVFVSDGGCSGLQYGMALEGQPGPDDLRFTFDDVNVVVDPVSIRHLAGTSIDYVDDLMGGGFRLENPNAVASCGCGQSFRTKDSRAEQGAAADNACNCGHEH